MRPKSKANIGRMAASYIRAHGAFLQHGSLLQEFFDEEGLVQVVFDPVVSRAVAVDDEGV